jgi:hypothetical protein
VTPVIFQLLKCCREVLESLNLICGQIHQRTVLIFFMVGEEFLLLDMLSSQTILCEQFVQKLQDESAFTNEEKVQMMQSIAEEFSVPFNSNTLEVKTCWWR